MWEPPATPSRSVRSKRQKKQRSPENYNFSRDAKTLTYTNRCPPEPASSGELGCGARGCVREGVIAGNWALHGMDASWVDIAGKTEVAYLTDNGMLSDMFQSFPLFCRESIRGTLPCVSRILTILSRRWAPCGILLLFISNLH